jgi:hypothetical protein
LVLSATAKLVGLVQLVEKEPLAEAGTGDPFRPRPGGLLSLLYTSLVGKHARELSESGHSLAHL